MRTEDEIMKGVGGFTQSELDSNPELRVLLALLEVAIDIRNQLVYGTTAKQ